jgi:serine/threonine-protein kinase
MSTRPALALVIDCPPPDQLLAFVAGELAEHRALEIENHMDSCGECRAVLSNMARGGPPPSLGRYRIDTVLGSGGMGIVYRGFDPQLARPVAIKVVRRAGDDSAGRARLIREAQALARLSHPNVCHVYDVGTQEDEVWVAMELIEGEHLRQWAVEGRTREEIIAALLGAAEGISAAHNAGLVHRDIKPENVLMTRDGRPIVTDFGLARHEDVINPHAPTVASDPQLTQTGAIAGTPAYLAPEQLLGDPIDARVDQFAWAVMAWELLTGSRPFPIVFAVRVEAIRAGLQQPTTLPKHLFECLAKAMSASPSERFPSMRELIDAFKATPAPEKTGPLVPVRGRTAALAGLGVLGASAVAVVLWQRPADNKPAAAAPVAAAELPAPGSAEPPPVAPTPTPAPSPGPVPTTATESQAVAPAPEPMPKADASPQVAIASPKPKTVKKDAASVGRTETPSTQTPPTQTPPPSAPQISQTEPQPPVFAPPTPPPSRGRYCRGCQIGSADAFCRIPTDFANTGYPRNFGVLDWGKVTKVENEAGTFREETIHETIITLRGQRKTYRFSADFLDTFVDAKVGDLLAICPEDESDIFRLSGGPTDKTRAVITLGGPPKTQVAAKLGAKHIDDIQLAAVSGRKRFDDRITADGRYMVRAQVYGIDGPRYRMDRYWMQVPKGMKGEDKLQTNASVWLVVENLEFVEIEGKEQLLVHAAAILDDLFPKP